MSPNSRNEFRRESGFTLVETLAVMLIASIIAMFVLPGQPVSTGRLRLEQTAMSWAIVLKNDRNAAIRRRMTIVSSLDLEARSLKSGVSTNAATAPSDVGLEFRPGSTCDARSIVFFPDGYSCGGTIALSRPGMTYLIKMNAATGGVEIVRPGS